MTAFLYCKTGPLAGSKYRIDDEAMIGRSDQNDITLSPDAVSEQHARIAFDDETGGYVLEDLDSETGTRVDDTEVIEPIPLDDLHIVTFADEVDFIFQAVDEETVAVADDELTAEPGETQFGMAPESPSSLSGQDEADDDRTRIGEMPGGLPDFSDADARSDSGEEDSSEDENRTRFGEAPPALPDFSDEDEATEDRTRIGEAPGGLPDLPEDESASEADEEAPAGDDRTQFGDPPPEPPDLSGEEEDDDGDRTRIGDAADALPDLSDEESETEAEDKGEAGNRTRTGDAPGSLPDLADEDAADDTDDEEAREGQTQFGGAPPDVPDLSEDAGSDEDAPGGDQTRVAGSGPGLPDLSEHESASEGHGNTPHEQLSPYAVQVVTESGPQDTHRLPCGEVTIGRSADCDIQIEDPGVSREHARLLVEPNQVSVEDMGSKNFTFIDGDRLSGRTALSPGSEIQFGLQVKVVLERASS